MGKNRVGLLFIGLLLAFSSASASSLGFGTTTLSRDTLNFGDTLIITSEIINYDAVPYQGIVNFAFELNGVQNANDKIFPNPLSGQFINLDPGDSIAVTIHIIITPAYFLPGPDILVVWPLCPDGSNPYNQLAETIFVGDPTGISSGADSPAWLKVYMALGSVFVNNSGTDFALNRVSIFDISGREISSVPCNSTSLQIEMNNQPSGIYFAEVSLSNGQRFVFKLFKL